MVIKFPVERLAWVSFFAEFLEPLGLPLANCCQQFYATLPYNFLGQIE